jgi:hypothetical protein
MSKRVKIAVIREATLNAKPTDTHYLAEGGLKISRKDARALKGTTLYYEVLVDLGEVTGFDFIPGRDIPVYQTDSEPVLALDPQSLRLVDWREDVAKKFMAFEPTESVTITVDQSLISQNATPVAPTPEEFQQTADKEQPATDAPVKRRPGRPKKVVAAAPAAPAPEAASYTLAEPVVADPSAETVMTVQTQTDFEVTEKQDDESTFLIDPDAPAPVAQSKPEFSFDGDEDEAPPPPPVRTIAPQNLGFEVEDDETSAPAPVAAPAEKPESTGTSLSNTDDFADVEPGLFDE